MKRNVGKPNRCIDPVMKYCQGCEWGHVTYPEWVETAEDLSWCRIETTCILGYDQGRPEDEPTDEEIQKWCDETIHLQEEIIEYQERLRSKRTDGKEEQHTVNPVQ